MKTTIQFILLASCMACGGQANSDISKDVQRLRTLFGNSTTSDADLQTTSDDATEMIREHVASVHGLNQDMIRTETDNDAAYNDPNYWTELRAQLGDDAFVVLNDFAFIWYDAHVAGTMTYDDAEQAIGKYLHYDISTDRSKSVSESVAAEVEEVFLRLKDAGVTFGFDGWMPVGDCGLRGYYLLVIDTASKTIYPINLAPCS